MNEDYLWDRSGPPDPEIERLERTLAPLRFRVRPVKPGDRRSRPRGAETAPWDGFVSPRVSPAPLRWAAAAAVVLAAVGASRFTPQTGPASAWRVESLAGAARLGVRDAAVSMAVPIGQAVRTGRESQLTMQADEVGRIDLGPDSVLHAATDRRVTLRRGELHAFIWAPPREFVVDTASARAVDLGCEYTLNVDDSGNGRLRVSMGWVAFQFAGHESFIPAGAECVTRKRGGPGIPFYEDAPAGLRQSLAAFEQGDRQAIAGILGPARPRDGLTLWHLLTRAPADDRGAVFERFAQLVPLPPGVTREGVLRGDARAIDLCWDALNLEDTSWWRGWDRKW